MNTVATATKDQRQRLFSQTGTQMGLPAPIIEKDFWVCWLLKQLFTIPDLNGWLVFKGGTSLSKCFKLIQRFSEDIDLAVDFGKLGFIGARDPRQEKLSHNKRVPLLREMMAACQDYIAGPFLSVVTARVASILDPDGWALRVSPTDANTIEFTYPVALETRLEYIRPQIILELGTHAEPIPRADYPIQPFAAERFPVVFTEPVCPVTTVVARRTFWEKATILHAEYYRPLGKPLLPRYSRHYADVAMMARSSVKNEALADLDLLRSVVVHKDRFYHCGWARYLDAKPGGFRLLPQDNRLPDLRRDHETMRMMFFSDPPMFDDVLENLAQLEREINRRP
jgi:hypothetical protein